MDFSVKKIGYFGLASFSVICSEMNPLQAMEVVANENQQKLDRQDNINNFDSFNINKKTIAYVQAARNTITFLKNRVVLLEVTSKEQFNMIIAASSCQIENTNKLNDINKIIEDLDVNVSTFVTEDSQFQKKPLEIFKNLVSIELKARNLEELSSVNNQVEQFSDEDIYSLLNKNQPIGNKSLKQSRQAVWNSIYKNTDDITDKNVIILSNLICDSRFDPSIMDKNFTYEDVYILLENICKKNEKAIHKAKALYYSARFICENIDNIGLNLTEKKQKKLAWKKLDKAKSISDCNYIKTFMAHLIINNSFIPEFCDNLNQAYLEAAKLLAQTEKKAEIKNPLITVKKTVQKITKSKMLTDLKIKSQYDKKSLLDKCLENVKEDSKKRKQDDLTADEKNNSSNDFSDDSRKKRRVEIQPRKAYHRLSDNDKVRILELHTDDGLNHKEIADEIGCSRAIVGDYIRKNA